MKKTATRRFIGFAALLSAVTLGSFAVSTPSSADENIPVRVERWAPEFHGRDAHASRRGYFLGVCVGQSLAQQGISVPVPQQGENQPLDPNTEAAMKAAAETCRSEMHGTTEPSPSPSGVPSTTPSEAPTGAPSTLPSSGTTSPLPTASAIPVPSSS